MASPAPSTNAYAQLGREWLQRQACQTASVHQQLAERSLHEFTRQLWRHVDPSSFCDNWHLGAICEYLEAVSRRQIQRLLINVPPRHSKSSLVSVMWPAWTWIHHPETRFMAASYAHTLSIRDSVKCRRVIESPVYRRRWGDRFRLTSDQNTKIRFDNDQNGNRLATSVGGALTGEGGDIIIIDDPHNVVEAGSDTVRQATLDWWDESMSNRLNDPQTGAYVLIMQRVHHQDLAGHLLDKGGWEHLCLPARYEPDHPYVSVRDERTRDGQLLWPERFPDKAVAQLEADLGSYGSAGQLQQRPTPRSGGMFDRGWWNEIVEAAPCRGYAVRGWDLAASVSGDWTAGCKMTLKDGTYWIEDMARLRGTPEKVERMIKSVAAQDGKNVLIDLPQDPGQAGKAQVRYLVQQLAGYNVRSSPESGAKEIRAEALSAQAEAGNVKLVRGAWNTAFIDEAAHFPYSDYDDQIDAASRAFHRLTLKESKPRARALGRPLGGR